MTSDNIQIKIKMTHTLRNLQPSPKPWSGLEGHGCSLHLQNQDSELKFGTHVYQRPAIIYKPGKRCQTPFRNLQCSPKPQIGT